MPGVSGGSAFAAGGPCMYARKKKSGSAARKRMRRGSLLSAAMFLGLLVSGCLGGGPSATEGEGPVESYLGRGHPYPEGDEWPMVDGQPLQGPFELLPVERVFVSAEDGTDLHVWIVRPDLPPGAGAPVVLWASPYFGTTQESGDDPALWDNSWAGEAVPVRLLVEHGYAVAIMNLRGSGLSGGCFTLFGSEDWDDTATVVDWLGEQGWSNGRVGMMGLSYHGTTPWQAAVRTPAHLKTIVTAGMISNLYTFFHSDQGAAQAVGPAFGTVIFGAVATVPPNEPADRIGGQWVPRLPERVCPETAAVLTELYTGDYGDVRSDAFWEERRIIRDMPQITSSVLLTHGLRDLTGHAVQEDPVWRALAEDTPKRMILGQWGHAFPNFSDSWTDTRESWDSVHLAWFDFWLKGIGAVPPGLGNVEYQEDSLAWRNATAWPPAEAAQQATYLCGGSLAAEPCSGPAGSFVSAPGMDSASDRVCGGPNAAADAVAEQVSLLFLSEPLTDDVVLAGNPFAYLGLESTEPGGLLSLYAYEVGPGGECRDEFRRITFGSADLRHHDGNYAGKDFPVGTPTKVRVDMTNLVERVSAGNRIAVVASYADVGHYEAVPFEPLLTVHSDSHIVWPVLEGDLGGALPDAEYPPRPFIPSS